MDRPTRDERSFLLQTLVNNSQKKFYNIVPWGLYIIKRFTYEINLVAKKASVFVIVSHFLLAWTNTLAY